MFRKYEAYTIGQDEYKDSEHSSKTGGTMKFTPYEKLSKKEKRKINLMKRKSWNGINPATKVVPDKTKYSRKRKHSSEYTE